MFLCLIIRMLERGGPTASSRRGSWPHSSPGTLWVDHKNLSLQILGWSSAWLRWMKTSRAFWSHARPVVPSYRRAWATSQWLEAFHVGCLASHRCHFQVTQTLFIASHCLLSTDNWLHSDQIGNKVGWKTRKKKRKKSQTMQPLQVPAIPAHRNLGKTLTAVTHTSAQYLLTVKNTAQEFITDLYTAQTSATWVWSRFLLQLDSLPLCSRPSLLCVCVIRFVFSF